MMLVFAPIIFRGILESVQDQVHKRRKKKRTVGFLAKTAGNGNHILPLSS